MQCSRTPGTWFDVIDVGNILFAHGDLNGCLFGVDNWAGFSPVFAGRGLPPGSTGELEELSDADVAFPTWATWAEVRAIDWEELAGAPDARIHEMVAGAGSNVVTGSKSTSCLLYTSPSPRD